MATGKNVRIPDNWLMDLVSRSFYVGDIEVWSEKDGNWKAQQGSQPTADTDNASLSVLVRVPKAKCLLGLGEELFQRSVFLTGKDTFSFNSYDMCDSETVAERKLRLMVWGEVSETLVHGVCVVKENTELGGTYRIPRGFRRPP